MIKKAIIRTVIEDYLLELKKTQEVTPQTVFDKLPDIYKLVKEHPEKLIPDNITYDVFVEACRVGWETRGMNPIERELHRQMREQGF